MNELTTYKESDEYNLLVDDCKAIITEGIFRSRQELIEMYQGLGGRIINDKLYKKVQEITGDKVFVVFEDDANRFDNQKYYGNYIDELEKHIFKRNWLFGNKEHILFQYPPAFIKIDF